MRFNNKSIVLAIVALIFMASSFTAIYFYQKNKNIDEALSGEKLKNELSLSEKLSLAKEISILRDELLKLNGRNDGLNKTIDELNLKLSQKETELNSVAYDRGKAKKLEKQLAEIKNAKNEISQEINELNSKLTKLENENKELNNQVSALQAQNKELTDNNKLLSSIKSDNLCIENQKKNDKLTIFAKRTKKINLSFDLPQEVVSNISFKVTKPDGTIVSDEKSGLSYLIIKNEPTFTASIAQNADELKVTKRINMTYQPKEKLKSGTYKVELFNNDIYLGSCQIKLR